jgi:hypothetical protein
MKDAESDRSPDNLDVEMVSLEEDAEGAVGGQARSLPAKALMALAARWRSSRRRGPVIYVAIIVSVIILLVMVARSSFPLPGGSAGEQQDAVLPPGYNDFFLQPDVPWTQIFIDGQRVEPPGAERASPLTLKPGHHLITWRAAPFQPQSCRISIPYAVGDSCKFAREEITPPGSTIGLQIILLHESLSTLPAAQQIALRNAIQASFDSIPASQRVLPGERYFTGNRTLVATQPLQATLRLSLDTDSDANCALDTEVMFPQTCTLAEQNCAQLCTIPWNAQGIPQEPRWFAFAQTHLSWDYTTLQGQPIASDQPIDNSSVNFASMTDQLTLLSITWQHDSWHIRPLLGSDLPSPTIVDSGDLGQPIGENIQLADDPACVAAQNIFVQLSAYSSSLLNASPQQIHYVSGANPAAGCVVTLPLIIDNATSTGGQTAIFLERFGVMLAVNDAAHRLQPDLPLADREEKTLAGQLTTIVGWRSSFSRSGDGH